MRRQKPHRVKPEEFTAQWSTWASATTVDGTQRKGLYAKHAHQLFQVRRRYLATADAEEVILQTSDLSAACDAYNRLT